MKPKTHSGAKKRIRLTGKGKIRMEKSCRNHLLNQKSGDQKSLGKSPREVSPSDAKKIKRVLPHK